MSKESIVRTIASVQFPGVYLQMNGIDVTNTAGGSGTLGVGHGGGPLDQFRISAPPTGGSPYVTSFESVAYPGVYMRMDGDGVTKADPLGGGSVNKQLGQSEYELFIIQPQSDGTVAIESKAFPGVYLRLSMGNTPAEPHLAINCQSGVGPLAKFRLETPSDTTRIRVLTYNTHLMQFSFLEDASDAERLKGAAPYTIWEDEARRDLIYRNIIDSLADIVSLQEVWSEEFEDWFKYFLSPPYWSFYTGDTKQIIFGTSTSGLLLCSKYHLRDYFFERFPDMEGYDDYSNKGVLCGTVDIPGVSVPLRIGTGHTTGKVSQTQWIRDHTVSNDMYKHCPALMMGDFNISWKKNDTNKEYHEMKTIFSFPGADLYPATNTWMDVHGEGLEPNPYTVKMCDNTLAQLFSPERKTEPDQTLDYLWAKPGLSMEWKPVEASVPRGPKWVYTSHHWHWGHPATVARMPAAAFFGDRLVVVTKERSALGLSAALLSSVYDKKTSKWVAYRPGFYTTAPPGIVTIGSTFHLFYRDGGGNAILHRAGVGSAWGSVANLGIDTGGSVCPILFKEQLHLLYVDPGTGPDSHGGLIFYQVNDGEGWGLEHWTMRKSTGITTKSDISAAVFNEKLYVFSKENGREDYAQKIQWSVLDEPGGDFRPLGDFYDLTTLGSPGVIAMGDRLHVYYRGRGGSGYHTIFHASYDGNELKESDQNTGYNTMIDGVCPVHFNNKLWLFYPYATGGQYYHDRIMIEAQLPETQVDLSDHYPLMVDLEARTISMNLLVDIRGRGKVLFEDGEWAGTRAETRPIDGFMLKSQIPKLQFTYMAHIEDVGDTAWEPDGTFIGFTGKRIEGFNIKLEGQAASSYELSYKAHLQNEGDTDLIPAGTYCGTRDEKRAVEAIWIQLKKIG